MANIVAQRPQVKEEFMFRKLQKKIQEIYKNYNKAQNTKMTIWKWVCILLRFRISQKLNIITRKWVFHHKKIWFVMLETLSSWQTGRNFKFLINYLIIYLFLPKICGLLFNLPLPITCSTYDNTITSTNIWQWFHFAYPVFSSCFL